MKKSVLDLTGKEAHKIWAKCHSECEECPLKVENTCLCDILKSKSDKTLNQVISDIEGIIVEI